ncbi:unannotated protein [freshwater metagenome]|uniref:Unannotated protein n=1 Tax=freshwater metagenome TaxID=449393 RepID=A0A6J7XTQ6_9ZZZZ|nr:NAD kinase [Actinomycetota bacterium]
MNNRCALLVVNPSRDEAVSAAHELSKFLMKNNFALYTISDLEIEGVTNRSIESLEEVEVVVVLGGDGTILRGAEVARIRNIPLLGVNLGRVGFMAEVDKFSIVEVAQCVVDKSYVIDERMVLSYRILRDGENISTGWALNEVTVERSETAMIELFLQIDERPLSRWGCDGIICATPTGSTAYAFSAGGPVVWPEVEALVLLPISAHALFSRPMVISPSSEIVIEIQSHRSQLSADALRRFELHENDRVVITKDAQTIKLAHIKATLFTDRLVAKFKLPIEGWRSE